MNKIAEFVKKSRRAAGLTQEEFAIRSGLGLRCLPPGEYLPSLTLLPVSLRAADGGRPAAGGGAHCVPGGTPAGRMLRRVPAVPPERAPRGAVYEPDLRLLRSDNIRSGAISFARQGWYT